jgi:hypothetical protein
LAVGPHVPFLGLLIHVCSAVSGQPIIDVHLVLGQVVETLPTPELEDLGPTHKVHWVASSVLLLACAELPSSTAHAFHRWPYLLTLAIANFLLAVLVSVVVFLEAAPNLLAKFWQLYPSHGCWLLWSQRSAATFAFELPALRFLAIISLPMIACCTRVLFYAAVRADNGCSLGL